MFSDGFFRIVYEDCDYICKSHYDLVQFLRKHHNTVFCVQFVSNEQYEKIYKPVYHSVIEYEALKILEQSKKNEEQCLPFR